MTAFATPPDTHHNKGFKIEVGGTKLDFSSYTMHDPEPAGRQIVALISATDVDDYILMRWLPTGDLDFVRLDQTINITQGAAKFVVAKNDRLYIFTLDELRQEWPMPLITGAVLGKLSKKPGEVDVFLERGEDADLEIEDNDTADLSSRGVERFYTRPRIKEVEIKVNDKSVRIRKGDRTGLQIKEAAIAAHVTIQLDFSLSLELGDGREKAVGDSDVVHVRRGMQFIAVASDDSSDV